MDWVLKNMCSHPFMYYFLPFSFSRYNLLGNTKGNVLTEHGACPVGNGTKWIATKWIRERGNLHHNYRHLGR